MEEIGKAPEFKRFIVEWEQGGLICNPIKEKLVVTENSFVFTRKGKDIFDGGPYWDNCEFKYKDTSERFLESFEKLCLCFLKTNNPELKMDGCDMSMFKIKCEHYDGTIVEEDYMGDFRENGLIDLIYSIKKFLPETTSTPYFFFGIPDEEEWEDLPF